MDKICSFLNQSVSPYHAVKQVKELLNKAGFQSLEEENLWQLEFGKCYYVTRNESSLLAFSYCTGQKCVCDSKSVHSF